MFCWQSEIHLKMSTVSISVLKMQTDILIPAENQENGSPTSHTEVTSMSLSFLLFTQRLNDPLQVFLRANKVNFYLGFFQRVEEQCPPLPHACTCSQDSKGPPGPSGPPVRADKWQPFFYNPFLFLNFLCVGSGGLIELSQRWYNYTSEVDLDTFFWTDFKCNVKQNMFSPGQVNIVLPRVKLDKI